MITTLLVVGLAALSVALALRGGSLRERFEASQQDLRRERAGRLEAERLLRSEIESRRIAHQMLAKRSTMWRERFYTAIEHSRKLVRDAEELTEDPS